jgi:hypothetical protein
MSGGSQSDEACVLPRPLLTGQNKDDECDDGSPFFNPAGVEALGLRVTPIST